ncbi:MAG: C45 family autoproteolytic acyltransferase/hydrolase, partial [Kofleriaceae bacterium]
LAGDLGAAARRLVRGVANAWQARLARERPRELAARTRAFAEAVREREARHDARLAQRTFATMDSLQNCIALVGRAQLGPFGDAATARATVAAVPACSSVIAWGEATEDGELAFARNFDFHGVGVWDAAPAFVVCAPDRGQRYGFFTTRGADVPAVTVVNEAGLVIAPHTRFHRGVTWGGAMIVDLVHEIARRAETLADAIAIARERPASSSWGVAVGSARERSAIVLELAGRHLDVVRPPAGASFLVCANRYRSAALQDGELAASSAWAIHSERREQRLRAQVEARPGPLGPRELAALLGDRHDVAAPDRTRRFGAIVASPVNVHAVVVAPAARRAWLGVDRAPVCEGAWAEIAWQWDGPTGGWEPGALAGTGFEVTARDGFVAPQDPATRHVHDAARAWDDEHDAGAALASIERAIDADPADPSLRLSAAWLALRLDARERAIAHVRAGLSTETEPYRRGQLLLWGARAARRRDPAQAQRWRDELERLEGAGLDELRAQARRRHRGRPHINLMMADAY